MTTLAGLEITVTAEDIEKGVKSDPCECPIALAIRRTAGPFSYRPAVCSNWVSTYDDSYDLPGEASEFIQAFDNGRDVEPFTFTVGAKIGDYEL